MTYELSQAAGLLADANPDALLADGFEEAFLGVAYRCGQESLATYSVTKCLKILMDRDGMSHGDAVEYFEFNVSGAWLGDGTPIWVYD